MREILERLKANEITVDEAQDGLEKIAFDRLKLNLVESLARLDVHREARAGIPEVILAQGKKPLWTVKLALEMAKEQGRAIVTRADSDLAEKLKESVPLECVVEVYEDARIVLVKKKDYKIIPTGGLVGILAAGTADIGVAEEVRIIAEQMGCEVLHAYDVGIAGVHRVLEPLSDMMSKDVDVIVVVAGMDAVLPITVKGLVNLPVIGVPTSVGYGIGDKGIAPLLTMLQSCAPGLAVVNIDNGFGAGSLAALIANRTAKFRKNPHACRQVGTKGDEN